MPQGADSSRTETMGVAFRDALRHNRWMGEPTDVRSRSSRRRGDTTRQLLRREDWIAAAQAELVRAGVSAITVGRLARRLRVTRGSFYWHFKDHSDLLRALLKFWEESNTGSFERTVARTSGGGGVTEFMAIIDLLVSEKDYSPAFDLAMRDWARAAPEVAAAVRRADERRMALLHRVFLDMGFSDPEALVRARITYFHQIGYYTLGLHHEDPAVRHRLLPYYLRALLGNSLEEIVAFPGTAASPRNPILSKALALRPRNRPASKLRPES